MKMTEKEKEQVLLVLEECAKCMGCEPEAAEAHSLIKVDKCKAAEVLCRALCGLAKYNPNPWTKGLCTLARVGERVLCRDKD